jgi:UDP:flavonoid glycosyltransferase YjiC (YdhE family)
VAKIILATMGSLGDLYPFVAIGLALKELGHKPVIASHDIYQETVENTGLEFAAIRPGEQDVFDRTGLDMGGLVLRATEDPWFLLRDVYLPFTPMMFEDVASIASGAAAIVAHNWAFGAIVAAEAGRIPLARVALSPLFLQSAIHPSVTGAAPYLSGPCGSPGIAYNRLIREVVRRQLAREMTPLEALRDGLGLATGYDHVFDFGRQDAAELILAIYSRAFAKIETDHNDRVVQCGFPRLDPTSFPLPEGLQAFLDAGPAPVIFTLGSFVANAGLDVYRAGLAASRRLGHRSILIASQDQIDRLRPLTAPDTFLCSYAPHALIFPRAAAIVHHGGIGTTGEALRSGKPQLVIPFLGDQPDNSQRLLRLGVARRLKIAGSPQPGTSIVEGIAGALRPLVDDARYRAAGAAIAAELIGERGAHRAALEIDRMVAKAEQTASHRQQRRLDFAPAANPGQEIVLSGA